MPHFNGLATLLNHHFHWNKARMDCLVGMVVALFFQGNHYLAKLAKAFPTRPKRIPITR
ncbi:MAG: hypothetical protein PHR16_12435 [Methylovulum sp.]|nr:hypothetical protein [Methylovulum sp.]